jgi:hypothetical protein
MTRGCTLSSFHFFGHALIYQAHDGVGRNNPLHGYMSPDGCMKESLLDFGSAKKKMNHCLRSTKKGDWYTV